MSAAAAPARHGALWMMPAREIVELVREGRVSCVELVHAFVNRCSVREASVQAWEDIDVPRALAQAAAADAKLGAGARPGPLQGLPIGVKDNIDVAGMPTRKGSAIMAGNVPTATAQCVARLEAAGAIVLGKTVTTEFAYFSPGKTRNPWNAAHTPGGSSSGSAAAVATGMAAAALGTQTNGSIVRPAAFCGVVGYKPTFGTVPNQGTLDPWPSLDHTGVLARSVADAALFASCMVDGGKHLAAARRSKRPPRLVAVRSPVWDEADAAQKDCFARCADRLRAAGAIVTEQELPIAFRIAHTAVRTIMAREAAVHFRRMRKEHGERMSAKLVALIEDGAAVRASQYQRALERQQHLREEFARYIAAYDAVITPPATGEAPATLDETGSPVFCSIWSLLGVPAINLPVALGPTGLPLGLQLVGAYGADHTLLGAAGWCEAHLGFAPTHRTESR
jgi:Asp-tRNA(Asn)/Glu-tRNA(Gln) amidotransferase A subunit family amidase